MPGTESMCDVGEYSSELVTENESKGTRDKQQAVS